MDATQSNSNLELDMKQNAYRAIVMTVLIVLQNERDDHFLFVDLRVM
ncbi:MAG: hypothetical protein MUC48_20035 [Leptolyngbya sp. Prado105]|jgi:hypothetical protein|nr:hypothetical protein [Leptolyngbya sp. Prado105]